MAQEVDAVTDIEEAKAPPPQETEKAVESAEQAVVDEKERIRDLEAKLTREGRSRAQIKQQVDEATRKLMSVETELAAAKQVNDRWKEWYLKNQASPQEREAESRTRLSREAQAAEDSKKEAQMLRAILKEDDPTVKRVLTSLADDGRYLSEKEIVALRRGLVAIEEPEEKDEEPPKVTTKKTTGDTKPNLDAQIKDAKEKKDGSRLLGLLAQKQGLERAK